MIYKYIFILLYFAILLAIGYVASRRIKNLKDFIIGGKKMGFIVASFSAQATGESAWLLLGLTGLGAVIGVSAYWVVIGEVLGVFIAWFLMAKPFKRLTDKYNSLTVPDFLESHFKSKSHVLRLVSSSALSIFVIIYISAQIDATGAAFESFLDFNYYLGAIIGFSIIIIYSVSGGFLAVCWTDLFQGIIMLLSLIFLPLVLIISIGSFDKIALGLNSLDPNLTNFFGGEITIQRIMAILGMALIGLGFVGSPQIFTRFISLRNENEINKGRYVAVVYTAIIGFCAVSIGVLGRYVFGNINLGNASQNVLPMLVEKTFHPVIIGIYVAAVLSAIMSTISSLLILASSSICRDLYQKIYKPNLSNEELASLVRKFTFITALIALAISLTISVLSPSRTIFWFVIFGWSGIAATFCPMIILSLFWKKYTEKGAIVSMISGFLAIPFFKFIGPKLPYIGDSISSLESLPPAFLLSLIAGIIVSYPRRSFN